MATEDFYAKIASAPSLEVCLDGEGCIPAPDDWDLAVADVAGSTQAILAGRYKEVNVVAASVIVAVLNSLKDLDVPFVFGGDGATLATPASRRRPVRGALAAARNLAREQFGFELRTGVVPIGRIRESGANVRVGRLEGAGAFPVAVLAGAGLREAERLLKTEQRKPAEQAEDSADAANFSGLECRWQPIRNRNGAIATLLVLPAVPDDDALICTILRKLRDAGTPPDSTPIEESQLHLTARSSDLSAEARIRSRGRQLFPGSIRLALMQAATAMAKLLIRWNLPAFGVRWGDYRRTVSANTDHLKLAGSLQCLLDVDPARFQRVIDWLEQRQRQGELAFGHHLEPAAHMTCMVLDRATRHFHFIDGSEGGYTRASQALKANLTAQ